MSETGLYLHPQVKSLLNLAQSVELDPMSRHVNWQGTGYVNHTQHNPSAGIETTFLRCYLHTWGLAPMAMHSVLTRVNKIIVWLKCELKF